MHDAYEFTNGIVFDFFYVVLLHLRSKQGSVLAATPRQGAYFYRWYFGRHCLPNLLHPESRWWAWKEKWINQDSNRGFKLSNIAHFIKVS